jgi:hypothetical protein
VIIQRHIVSYIAIATENRGARIVMAIAIGYMAQHHVGELRIGETISESEQNTSSRRQATHIGSNVCTRRTISEAASSPSQSHSGDKLWPIGCSPWRGRQMRSPVSPAMPKKSPHVSCAIALYPRSLSCLTVSSQLTSEIQKH